MTRKSILNSCLAFAAGGAMLLLQASGALAQGFGFHGGMGGHRNMGNMHEHEPFAPNRSFSRPPGMMPPPPSPTARTGGGPPGPVGGSGANGGTGTGATGTHHHHDFDDDDDVFFFAAFPFPDPFFVDVVQPVYISPNGQYWYWCPSARAYYPWVRSCDVPWQPVPATLPPPPPG
jgi:hypothetical protein